MIFYASENERQSSGRYQKHLESLSRKMIDNGATVAYNSFQAQIRLLAYHIAIAYAYRCADKESEQTATLTIGG